MKTAKSLTAIAVLALSCSSVAAYAQLLPMAISPTTTTTTTSTTSSTTTSPTTTTTSIAPTTTTTTSIAPTTTTTSTASTTATTTAVAAPAPAPVAPAATNFSAGHGEGYEHANAKGKAAIEEHFSMSGSVSGDVLTVTSISGGHIAVGQKLTGKGLPASGIMVTEFLTGTGGAGTYKFKAL